MSYRLNFLYFSLVLIGVLQLMLFYSHLPDPLASHFGRGGLPNGWMPRNALLWLHAGLLLLMTLIYLFASRLKLPSSTKYISLPNRDYWLNPQRKSATERYLGEQTRWFVFYTLLFLLVVMQLVINANMQAEVRLDEQSMWYALFIYGVYIVVWTVRFYRHFLNIDQ